MITWGQVHVGDVVRGADQRGWEVAERGETHAWVLDGEQAAFVMVHGDREVRIVRRLADPVDMLQRADHTDTAAAFDVLAAAGLNPQPIEETRPMSDPFQSAVVEPKFDRYGRYLLPDPETGKERAWTRVSTVARTLKDEYGLTQWKMRMVAKGVAIRPDLIALAAAADPVDDKSDLQSVADKAMEAAEAGKGANFGTAMHAFTRRLDAGESLSALRVPKDLLPDLQAYAECLKANRYVVRESERVVVLPELGIAGRFDRLGHSILDLKTGVNLDFSWLEIAIQQALYAHAPLMWVPQTNSYEPKPPVDLDRGLILHLPIGEGAAAMFGVNLIKGWQRVQLAMEVRQARREARGYSWLLKPNDDPISVALHKIRTADQTELAAMWDSLNKRGLWTEEINAAAMTRFEEIKDEENNRAEAAGVPLG